jgi:hypothetical protein
MKIELNIKDSDSGSGGSIGANCTGIEQPTSLKTIRVSDKKVQQSASQ